jgi:hypothetical protein
MRFARLARRLWAVSSEAVMACAPLRRPCDSASNPDWFRRVLRMGHPTFLVRQPSGHSSLSSRTKSVIRDSTIFPPQMVTGEFYAWVTACSITPLVRGSNASGTNVLHVGGYGRVAIIVLIKAVLLCNRYVNIFVRLTGNDRVLTVDNSTQFVFSRPPPTSNSLLWLLTDQ